MTEYVFKPLVLPKVETKANYINIDPFNGRYFSNKQNMYQAILVNDEIAKNYWPIFTASKQQIFTKPEQYYIGLVTQKSLALADIWRDY